MTRFKHTKALALVVMLVFVMGQTGPCGLPDGEPGPPGVPGEDGEPGEPGTDGEDGGDGLACWDLDADGVCDQDEDKNNDDICDALDCQGLPGQDGEDGDDGSDATITAGQGINVDSGEVLLDTNYTNGLYWKLGGNSGTTAGSDFLGTTDNSALELHVNGTRALRLEPNGTSPNVIGGFGGNSVTNEGCVIAGRGSAAEVHAITTSPYSTVGGGSGNSIDNASWGTIGGGHNNQIQSDGDRGTIGGGRANIVSGGSNATVGGGKSNTASERGTTVSGGEGNSASGEYSTVCGGEDNVASGANSFVAGGGSNHAQGFYSFAAGDDAKALHNGSFVWSDASGGELESSADNELTAQASGGVRFFSDSGATTGVTLAPGSGSWASVSDRNAKENFSPIDSKQILEGLSSIRIETWNYREQGKAIRHIGPMAQDFYEAFGLGRGDKHITTVDADGVALAAIQALRAIVRDQEKRISELEGKLTRQSQTISLRRSLGKGSGASVDN